MSNNSGTAVSYAVRGVAQALADIAGADNDLLTPKPTYLTGVGIVQSLRSGSLTFPPSNVAAAPTRLVIRCRR